jgi:hypothetical protein
MLYDKGSKARRSKGESPHSVDMRRIRAHLLARLLSAQIGEGVWDPMEQSFIASYKPDVLVLVPMGSHFWADYLTSQVRGVHV